MADQNNSVSLSSCTDAVCIDANKIYDSCCDRDCLENLRVYFSEADQEIIDNATSIKCTSATVLNVTTDVEPVTFNRGFYSVDATFYFKITAEVCCGSSMPPQTVCGMAMFTKKCILFGSEGNAKIFSSEMSACSCKEHQLKPKSNVPRITVQVVDPIVLSARLAEECECSDLCCNIPECILCLFNGRFGIETKKVVRISLGLFTIMQLSRSVQLLVPVFDFCMPTKECNCNTENSSPCEIFERISFPKDEFFPPQDNCCNPCKAEENCDCDE